MDIKEAFASVVLSYEVWMNLHVNWNEIVKTSTLEIVVETVSDNWQSFRM